MLQINKYIDKCGEIRATKTIFSLFSDGEKTYKRGQKCLNFMALLVVMCKIRTYIFSKYREFLISLEYFSLEQIFIAVLHPNRID